MSNINKSNLFFPSLNDLKFYDSLQIPTLYDKQLKSYKEWQHFNVFDQKNKLFVMFNLSIMGNPFDSQKGVVAKTALVKTSDNQMFYALEPRNNKNLKISHLKPNLSFEDASVNFVSNSYELLVKMETIPVEAKLLFEPISDPIAAYAKNFGSGQIGWLAVPKLRVSGEIIVNQTTYRINQAIGYHDHDWGRFFWGEKIGWEWGVFTENRKNGLTIVVDQRTDGIRGKVDEKFVIIYRNGKIIKIFSSDEIIFSLEDYFQGTKETTPGLMRVMYPYQSSEVPKKFKIEIKKSGTEKIKMEFKSTKVIQIIVPNQYGDGETQLNQIFGDIKIKSSIKEVPIRSDFSGYFESVGPI